jgi:O-antigen/teichoic acid export membrane protein
MSEQPVTTSKRLIHNTIINVLTLVSNALIGFFLVRFFLGQLGEAQYGVWVLIGSLFRYRGILSMGLNSSANRYIPMYRAKNNDAGVQRVISSTLFFYLFMAILCVVFSLVIYFNIGSWFAIAPELVTVAGALVLVVGFCFALALPMQLSSAILAGLQRYDMINLTLLVTLLLRTILLVVLLLRGYSLLAMGLVFGISEILVRVSQFFFVKKLLPEVSISLRSVDFGLLREMVAYGTNTFLYTMGGIITLKASDLVIGIFLGTSPLSRFAVASAAVVLLSQLLQAFTRAIMPAVSDLDARDDQSRVKEIAFLTQKYSLLLIIPSGYFLIAMGRQFLWVWVGEKFQNPAVIDGMGAILAILAVGHCLRLAQHSNFLVLVGRGQHKMFGIFTALTAVLCVVGSVISVKVFGWGLLGIAWSNLVPMVLISGMILPIYFNRKMNISIMDNIIHVLRPALQASLPSVVLISIWKYLAPPGSWIEIFAVVLTTIAITLISSWVFGLSKLERKRFLSILAVKTGKR